MAQLNMVSAVNRALDEALRQDDRVVLLGQDIGKDEGVFRVTADLLKRYGDNRVIDTPLAEGAIVGGAIGMESGDTILISWRGGTVGCHSVALLLSSV